MRAIARGFTHLLESDVSFVSDREGNAVRHCQLRTPLRIDILQAASRTFAEAFYQALVVRHASLALFFFCGESGRGGMGGDSVRSLYLSNACLASCERAWVCARMCTCTTYFRYSVSSHSTHPYVVHTTSTTRRSGWRVRFFGQRKEYPMQVSVVNVLRWGPSTHQFLFFSAYCLRPWGAACFYLFHAVALFGSGRV